MISARTHAAITELAGQFSRREPFRHVVIDGFFEPAAAQRLLDQFPAFDAGHTLDETDAQELRGLLARRDTHIQRLYRDVQALQAHVEKWQGYLGLVRGSRLFRTVAFIRRLIRRGG